MERCVSLGFSGRSCGLYRGLMLAPLGPGAGFPILNPRGREMSLLQSGCPSLTFAHFSLFLFPPRPPAISPELHSLVHVLIIPAGCLRITSEGSSAPHPVVSRCPFPSLLFSRPITAWGQSPKWLSSSSRFRQADLPRHNPNHPICHHPNHTSNNLWGLPTACQTKSTALTLVSEAFHALPVTFLHHRAFYIFHAPSSLPRLGKS